MAEFMGIFKRDSKVQNEISKTLGKNYKESCSTQSKMGQSALYHSNVFQQAIFIIRDTIEYMVKEIEHRDEKIEFLEKK